MSALPHFSGTARRAALRRTVRLRLTALYGTLFLASGAGLLTVQPAGTCRANWACGIA